jgi:cell volume regulation protein A
MHEISTFGTAVLVVSGGLVAALFASKASARLRVPGPVLFLVAAAVAAAIWPASDALSVRTVERIGIVALIAILFDGGMQVGRRRFVEAAVPILTLGLVGTVATAALLAASGHWLLGFSWTTAWLLGAALAPTDPAVMFSVLGAREIAGQARTILEGESGVNDPVGISLTIGLLELAEHPEHSTWSVVGEFAIQMSVGAAVGLLVGWLLVHALRRIALPSDALYPLRTLAAAGLVYGTASVLHGSGFLAVFIAGIVLSDEDVPHRSGIVRFHTSLASLAEIVVFAALGLTIRLHDLDSWQLWADAGALAVLLAFVARPVVVGPLLVPSRLSRGERIFVMWSGLKGAVPLLLGTLVLLAGVEDARRIYELIFIVVAASVLVQGTSVPFVARRLGLD